MVARGLVRFAYPESWVVEGAAGAIMLHDQPPPGESCDMGGSRFPIPRELAQQVPLEELLGNSLDQGRDACYQSEMRSDFNPEREILWVEEHYIDPEHKRDARSRVAIIRGSILCLIS